MPQAVAWAAFNLVGGAASALGLGAYASATAAAFAYKYAFVALLATASTVYSRSAAKKAARRARAGLDQGRTFMVREPTASRDIVYGEVRKSGTLVFAHVTGAKNEFIHLIIAVAGHEVEAINDIYINDEVIALDGGGIATTAPYAGLIRIKKYLGTAAQTADADLIAEAPSFWTSDHRLRGIAYIYARLKFSADAFPGGIPNISAIVRGKKVYDPRSTTTAYSRNWALCLGDYLLDTKLGLGVDLSRINDAAWIAAANIADEDINLNPTGTEKRYTINGVVSSAAIPGDVLPLLVDAGAGFLGYIGGKWVVHAGAYRTPTITLDENDLRGPITIQTKASRREIFNGVKGVFTSPDNQWQASDFPPITNATATTEDGGVRIWRDIELPFTTSPATAQRLAKISLSRARQQITVTLACKLTAFRIQAGDTVMLTNTRMGWTSKVFEVSEFSFAPEPQEGGATALGIDLVLRETASAVWDWADGEETIVDPAPNTDLPDPFDVPTPTGLTLTSGASTLYVQADGTVLPRVVIAWDSPPDEFVTSGGFTSIEYKKSADPDWLEWVTVKGDITSDILTDVAVGEDYDVRIRHQNRLAVRGAYLTITDHTVVGKTAAPNQVTDLAAIPVQGGIRISWALPADPDLAGVQIYAAGTSTQPANPLIASSRRAASIELLGMLPGEGRYLWVRTIDTSGNAAAVQSIGLVFSDGRNEGLSPVVAITASSAPAKYAEYEIGPYFGTYASSHLWLRLQGDNFAWAAADAMYRRSPGIVTMFIRSASAPSTPSFSTASGAATFSDDAGDLVCNVTGHGLADGREVYFSLGGGAVLPGGVSLAPSPATYSVPCYVRTRDANSFYLAAGYSDVARIPYSSTGSGTITMVSVSDPAGWQQFPPAGSDILYLTRSSFADSGPNAWGAAKRVITP